MPRAPSAASSAGFLVFRDTSFGFRVGYPPDWAAQSGTEGTVVTFLAPGSTAGARASVSVLAQPLSDPSQTLDHFADIQRLKTRLRETGQLRIRFDKTRQRIGAR